MGERAWERGEMGKGRWGGRVGGTRGLVGDKGHGRRKAAWTIVNGGWLRG